VREQCSDYKETKGEDKVEAKASGEEKRKEKAKVEEALNQWD
jgi:hypothetical protein